MILINLNKIKKCYFLLINNKIFILFYYIYNLKYLLQNYILFYFIIKFILKIEYYLKFLYLLYI